ncbi:MAG TPA: dual specificity protein phosphatase family protein [Planctomycetota bacterium]|nr:dual specificity protein phosphatase family protein [Planctomycetota bacterium]
MRRPAWIESALWAAACSKLFILVYGGCTWITDRRIDVGSIQFEWERRLPFIPGMILPYWSLDLFFLGSFFLCTDRKERRILGGRITAAILGAGVCFLLFPLKMKVTRPAGAGSWKPLFDVLWSFDRPYNLFPSLHIALVTILAEHYARHTRGLLHTGILGWFALVAVSTLLTWQHHAIDLAGGFVLGLLCLRLVGGAPAAFPTPARPRIGGYYLLASAAAFGLASVLPPAGLILLWPALSLALVAAGYFGAGPAVYGKSGPSLPFSAAILLAPCLAGQVLSWAFYRRRGAVSNTVAPGVRIGAWPTEGEARRAVREGVRAVLDLTAEFPEAAAFRSVEYHNIPVLDLTAPTPAQLQEAVGFIEEQSRREIVYVHCKAGYSRSAAAVGAWLLDSGRAASAEDAIALLRKIRPQIVVRPEVRRALEDWERAGRRTPLRLEAEAQPRV